MKKLFKNMSIYGFGGVLSKAINFLLLPIYTRLLTPVDYGTLELVYMIGQMLAIFYGFMVTSGYTRNYYEHEDIKYKKMLLGTTFWFVLVSSVIVALLSFAFSTQISKLVFNNIESALYIKLITVSSVLMALAEVFYVTLMVQQKAKKYVTINIITLIITLIVTIYFVVFLRIGVLGVLYGQVIGRIVQIIIISIKYINKSVFVFSYKALKEMLVFSLPLLLPQVTYFILNLADRFFIRAYSGVDDVGIYSLGLRFASIIPLFAVIPLKAWGPHLFSLAKNENKCKDTIAKFTRLYLAGIIILSLLISLFSREVIMIMAKSEFWSAWQVVYWLCLTQVFWGLANVTCFAFHVTKKTFIMSKIEVFAAILTFILNLIIVKQFGMIGAAGVKTFSYLTIIILYFFYIGKIYPIKFEYSKMTILILSSLLIYGISLLINFNIIYSMTIKLLFLVGFITLLYFTNYFKKEEKHRMRLYIINKLSTMKIISKHETL